MNLSDCPTTQQPAEKPSRLGLVSWLLYDFASNAYAAIVLTFLFAPYFTQRIAADETSGQIYWGLMLGAAGILVGIGGPLIGATADQSGRRKPALLGFTLLAIVAVGLLWFIQPSVDYFWWALLVVAVGELGVEYAGVLYNAMLPTLVPRQRVGRWSGWGWTAGYLGGLLCLVLALLLFIREPAVIELDRESAEHVRAAFPLAAIWFLVFASGLILFTPDTPSTGKPLTEAFRDGLRQIADSARNVRRYANIVKFLIARLIYIDGLATLFMFGGVYAAAEFEMDAGQILLFGIVLNVAAGIGAMAFSWIDDWIGGRATILISLVGLIVPAVLILLVTSETWFWVLAMVIGLFVGPVQAASRSFLSRIAPPSLRNQMFGLYAFSGKVAFFCPLLVAALTFLTGSLRVGMTAIILFFVIGLLLMWMVPASAEEASEDPSDSAQANGD